MLRWFVALTPLTGAIVFPLVVPFTIARLGLAPGVVVALTLSTLWLVVMLRTAEMPH